MNLQLAWLVERVKINFDDKRLTGAFSHRVIKAIDSMWIERLLIKLTIIDVPSYMVKIITSHLHSHVCLSFKAANTSCRLKRAGEPDKGVISAIIFNLIVN